MTWKGTTNIIEVQFLTQTLSLCCHAAWGGQGIWKSSAMPPLHCENIHYWMPLHSLHAALLEIQHIELLFISHFLGTRGQEYVKLCNPFMDRYKLCIMVKKYHFLALLLVKWWPLKLPMGRLERPDVRHGHTSVWPAEHREHCHCSGHLNSLN